MLFNLYAYDCKYSQIECRECMDEYIIPIRKNVHDFFINLLCIYEGSPIATMYLVMTDSGYELDMFAIRVITGDQTETYELCLSDNDSTRLSKIIYKELYKISKS